jgi:hypothetical protein
MPHFWASLSEAMIFTPSWARASRYREYMDKRVMVAVGILENFIGVRMG